jgi:hypothetical protein
MRPKANPLCPHFPKGDLKAINYLRISCKSSTVGDAEERHKRAMEIVGKFISGKRDISKKHDLYLADAYHK